MMVMIPFLSTVSEFCGIASEPVAVRVTCESGVEAGQGGRWMGEGLTEVVDFIGP